MAQNDRRNTPLALGFTLILVLSAILVGIGLSYMDSHNRRLNAVVQQDNVKTELILAMRNVALERMVILHRMLLATDPFERDELNQRFSSSAGEFIQARDRYLLMQLSPQERDAFAAALALVQEAQLAQNLVVESIMDRRTGDARRQIMTVAVPSQNRVLESYNLILAHQQGAAAESQRGAARAYQVAVRSMLVVGGLVLAMGVVIAVLVSRRIRRDGEELARQKERAEVTLHSIADAVITADAAGRVDYLNPVAEYLTGWSTEKALGRPLREVFVVVNELSREPLAHPAYDFLPDGHAVGLESHTLLVSRDGREFAIEDSVAPIRDEWGATVGVVLVFHDVTESRSLARQLSWQASHDPLTRLPNRREFEARLTRLLETARTEGRRHALLYVDLDQFKVVNDTCGHMAGDELLRQLTVVLQDRLPPEALMARLGGDEFGLLLENTSLEGAQNLAATVLEVTQGFRFVWEDKTFTIGASIGLVEIDRHSRSVPALLSAADTACYTAKNKGRNRVQTFQRDDVELAQVHGEMEWVARITKGFEEDRFRLFRQRIVPVSGLEEGEHVELLLRLEDEDGQLIPPAAFIPAAERYNLMPSLDRWVIRHAFAAYMSRPAEDACRDTLSINLSGASLTDEYFLDFVHDQFAIYAMPPCAVCFEITETAAIANLGQAVRLIGELKKLGCRFALDDFGSGMSSFAYLKNLDVDYLKVDGAFVRDMVHDEVDFAMVEAINRVGHVMGLQTIAEFVENDAILAKLRELGVDYAQGYGLHQPEPFPGGRR